MVPARFDQLAGQSFHAEISTEQPDLLDQNDVVGWITSPGTPPGLEQQPGNPALRVGREGRVVELTGEQGCPVVQQRAEHAGAARSPAR